MHTHLHNMPEIHITKDCIVQIKKKDKKHEKEMLDERDRERERIGLFFRKFGLLGRRLRGLVLFPLAINRRLSLRLALGLDLWWNTI